MKFDRLLDEVKSRIDIVEFISDYVNLTKAGQNHKGLCPFHSEKFPSFTVNQAKQIFHCFGCGVGGDVISFLMKHDNLSFTEAVEYLAKKAGIKIPTDHHASPGAYKKTSSIYKANEEALQYFVNNLKRSPHALAYLRKTRGMDEKTIETFQLGYATGQREGLCRHMLKKGYEKDLLKEAGLVFVDQAGCRDMFWNRIMFPISNLKNDIIAFGGRVMDDSLPKYLNSPETYVFRKREALFALNLAKSNIRREGYALLVEGYLDAIICHQFGFQNTVAPLGTALTEGQVKRLRTLSKKVILVYDGDTAGIGAARKSLKVLCEGDTHVRVLLLPTGEDPDTFLRKRGADVFRTMIMQSLSAVDFMMQTSKGEKNEFIREILGLIAVLDDRIRADEMVRELADKSRIHEPVLRDEVNKLRKKAPAYSSTERQKEKRSRNREEYLLLGSLIAFPEKTQEVLSQLDIGDLRQETVKSIFTKIQKGKNISLNAAFEEFNEPEKDLITELSLYPQIDEGIVDRVIQDCMKILLKRKIDEKRKIAEQTGDITLLNALLKEKRRIIKKELE
jgi:DNA primase